MNHKGGNCESKQVGSYVFNPETDILGKGAFATVYKGSDIANNSKPVAIKAIPNSVLFDSEEQYIRIMREIHILQQITGPHIVHLLDSRRTANNLYLVTEYCNGGDLEGYLEKHGSLSEEESLYILKQLTYAFISLQNIEGGTIMHRDIKPANILFNDGFVKIADFGFAKMVDENAKDVKDRHTLLGTPYYMNPQTLGNEEYSTKCDIWSTGFVFYECLYGHTPWTGTSIPGLLESIKKDPLEFPKEKPIKQETIDLITSMLKFNEEDRLDWNGVWNHPALKKIKLSTETDKKKAPIKILNKEPINIPKGPFSNSPRYQGAATDAKGGIGQVDGKIKGQVILYVPGKDNLGIDEQNHKEGKTVITIPYTNIKVGGSPANRSPRNS